MANRLPLTSTDFQNNDNSLLPQIPSNDNLAKSEHFFEGKPAETSTSFLDVEPSPIDTATRASNSRSDTPIKSSTTIQYESSIQKKTIRKLRDVEDFTTKLKLKSNFRQTKRTQGSAIKTSPNKRRFIEDYDPLKTSPFEEKDTAVSSPCTSNRDVSTAEDLKPKSVCFLNKMNLDEKIMSFSGLNVMVEEDETALSFPTHQQTAKFVV